MTKSLKYYVDNAKTYIYNPPLLIYYFNRNNMIENKIFDQVYYNHLKTDRVPGVISYFHVPNNQFELKFIK